MSGCFYCGKTDQETRPYGPRGSPVCFACATSSPEREAVATSMFQSQLDAALQLGGSVLIGEQSGPRPLHNIHPLQ